MDKNTITETLIAVILFSMAKLTVKTNPAPMLKNITMDLQDFFQTFIQ